MGLLEVNDIFKNYGDAPVLRGVSIEANAGEVLCLLGPSGCGKTTLLRIIAGLETADAGAVIFDGQRINNVPAYERGFGLMFQDYALFPHRNVMDNVAFGLRMQRLPRADIAQRTAEMLELVGLERYGSRRVYDLSGGERQRVALARALAPRPRLLMLDEPLAALDRALRERLQDELARILRTVGVTSVYVTHDQQEAFALADRIVLFNRGRIEQEGTPEQVYRYPGSPWAARFLGMTNFVPDCTLHRTSGGLVVSSPLGTFHLAGRLDNSASWIENRVTLLLRPDAAFLPSQAQIETTITGILTECNFRGTHYRITLLHTSGIELTFEGEQPPATLGQQVTLALREEGLMAWPDVQIAIDAQLAA